MRLISCALLILLASTLPVWALLTLTDNESQRVQIFTPQ
jgi:carbon starvation protein CstA